MPRAAQIAQALATRQAELEAERDARVLVEEAVDVTLPTDRRLAGARHPLTTIQERIEDIFVAMGYEVAEGPEVEAAWFNFDALNTPADHPAARSDRHLLRRRRPTPGSVLRTQTSPVQIRDDARAASRRSTSCAPARCSAPTSSTRRTRPVFHQVEGLAVDEGITMAHLKGTLDHMAAVDVRRRHRAPGCARPTSRSPSRAPRWTCVCFVCRGESVGNPDRPCRTCSSEGWIEWGGCGMVDPRVLAACGIDPERYTGFAFGMGIERTLMFRNGVADMRDMVEGDVRFTAAFGMES